MKRLAAKARGEWRGMSRQGQIGFAMILVVMVPALLLMAGGALWLMVTDWKFALSFGGAAVLAIGIVLMARGGDW